jgi:hypothetical protein
VALALFALVSCSSNPDEMSAEGWNRLERALDGLDRPPGVVEVRRLHQGGACRGPGCSGAFVMTVLRRPRGEVSCADVQFVVRHSGLRAEEGLDNQTACMFFGSTGDYTVSVQRNPCLTIDGYCLYISLG